jgi:exosortase N
MIVTSAISSRYKFVYIVPVILLLTNIFVSAVLLKEYVLLQPVNFLFAATGFVFTMSSPRSATGSMHMSIIALIFAWLTFVLPQNTMLFFVLLFAILAVVDNFYRKTGILSVLILLFMSPFFQFVSNMFTFPIRLQLTKYAGKILSVTGGQTQVAGNVIYYQGNEFAVDPECMGLNMMVTSLLLGVVLFAYISRIHTIKRLLFWLILVLTTIFLLNIFSNLLRIISLVHFSIPPENIAHEWVGLCCFLVYVVIPSLWMGKLLVKKQGKLKGVDSRASEKPSGLGKTMAIHFLLIASVLMAANNIYRHRQVVATDKKVAIQLTGFTSQKVSPDILKLENGQSLVYIKAIQGFYNADHNPSICWKGSGYEFKQVQEARFFGTNLYTAILQKDKETLYTAWWYDNGNKRTNEQLAWRWDVLKGANNYSVVNVTSATKDDLVKELANCLQKNQLQQIFANK